jgi:2-alkyl-3-oxoalkanoate reductase
MRIFLAGGSGAIGKHLVPLLTGARHEVVASTRTSSKQDSLRAAGAQPVILDILDRDAVMKVVADAKPDVVIHQVTALASVHSFKNPDREFAITNALRTQGTDHLLAAARLAGARRFIAQSYTGWPNIREGGRVKTEDDPLDSRPPRTMTRTLGAIRRLETSVSTLIGMTGIVLRYGSWYGPGTPLSADGEITEMVRQRKFPIVGGGTGVWSFTHIQDAAEATRLAVEQGGGGIYNIVDDEPAEVAVWLPELAQAIGARRPYRVPAWLVRPMIGDALVERLTSARGSSNAKAKRVLGWEPMYPSWRDGFRRALGSSQSYG